MELLKAGEFTVSSVFIKYSQMTSLSTFLVMISRTLGPEFGKKKKKWKLNATVNNSSLHL